MMKRSNIDVISLTLSGKNLSGRITPVNNFAYLFLKMKRYDSCKKRLLFDPANEGLLDETVTAYNDYMTDLLLFMKNYKIKEKRIVNILNGYKSLTPERLLSLQQGCMDLLAFNAGLIDRETVNSNFDKREYFVQDFNDIDNNIIEFMTSKK